MLQTFFTRKAFKGHSTGTLRALGHSKGVWALKYLGTWGLGHSKHSRHFLWQISQNLVNMVKLLKLQIILYHTLFTSFHQSIWWLLWQCQDYCLNFYLFHHDRFTTIKSIRKRENHTIFWFVQFPFKEICKFISLNPNVLYKVFNMIGKLLKWMP